MCLSVSAAGSLGLGRARRYPGRTSFEGYSGLPWRPFPEVIATDALCSQPGLPLPAAPAPASDADGIRPDGSTCCQSSCPYNP